MMLAKAAAFGRVVSRSISLGVQARIFSSSQTNQDAVGLANIKDLTQTNYTEEFDQGLTEEDKSKIRRIKTAFFPGR